MENTFINSLIELSLVRDKFFKIGDTIHIAYYDSENIDLWDTETNEARVPIGFRRLMYLCTLGNPIVEITEDQLPTDINREFNSKLCSSRYYKGDLYIPFPSLNVCRAPSDYNIENLFSDFTIVFENEDYIILCPALLEHTNNILEIFEEYKDRLKNWEEFYSYSYARLIDIQQKCNNEQIRDI
jgi:hypothetical protein